ncbi:glucuronate isomerase [Vibrio casei]|uniref:Uronate isomerase n=1 Tax=Vibrio casei TaxID=673372 RepID=A0A368LGW5_9VIBR|nr:glucuronate isomerase [Vibrio casei]RCS69990.1 glucuronate isomerase [Vibrio casei]SJN31330.1 Uronate isomerase [Vibrio casei]
MTPSYIHDDFLLQTDTAKKLFHSYAKSLPIIDYHNHLDAKDIYLNSQFQTISEAWLIQDHYVWRAMRSCGVDEHYITGEASEFEKFDHWCRCMPNLLGNPLYPWSHLELKRYFEIDSLIEPQNTNMLWQSCNQKLSQQNFKMQSIIERSNVEVLCTTDSPLSTLKYHKRLAESDFKTKVLPTFRGDDIYQIEDSHKFKLIIEQLSDICDGSITCFSEYLNALTQRIDYFHHHGCRLSDLGLKKVHFTSSTAIECDTIFTKILADVSINDVEKMQLESAIFIHLGKTYHQYGWCMQLHIGVHTNVNTRRLKTLGAGSGFSVMHDGQIIEPLCQLLDQLDQDRMLSKTILYCLNPKDFDSLACIIGAFQDSDSASGKIQLGPAWWFNDHKRGMEKQLESIANLGALGCFVGMLTDSRNVFSLSRHEYFRRVLCNLIGRWAEQGEIPNNPALLKTIVENICYYNARQYFNF